MVKKKVEDFFKTKNKKIYRKGEILIRAGEDPSSVFYLTEGKVKEYAISKKGDELVVNIFKPYAFFPMSWAINGTKNEYYFEAMEECRIHKSTKEDAVKFLKDNTDVMYDLLSRVYLGTDGLLTKMTYLMLGSARARLLSEIIIQAKRFGVYKNGIQIAISEKDLSSQTGISRETVSREFRNLTKKGILFYSNKNLNIPDFAKLERELLEDY